MPQNCNYFIRNSNRVESVNLAESISLILNAKFGLGKVEAELTLNEFNCPRAKPQENGNFESFLGPRKFSFYSWKRFESIHFPQRGFRNLN